jgi:hypothetical protein
MINKTNQEVQHKKNNIKILSYSIRKFVYFFLIFTNDFSKNILLHRIYNNIGIRNAVSKNNI